MTTDLDQLNAQFAIPDRITFKAGAGDLPLAEIITDDGTRATVSLHGAHVLTYQPAGQAPVLWLSEHSRFEAGQAIRGGIPVIWPWFGPHPTDPTLPAHGLARTRLWQVLNTTVLFEDTFQLRLGLTNDTQTQVLWPHPFALEVVVTVGQMLAVELIAHNRAEVAVTCGAALHSYFTLSDIADVAVTGLEETAYLDKVDGGRRKMQAGPITFSQETDRIYLDTIADCLIVDPGLHRQIRVAKSGSHSTVVWNPWVEKSRRMADFGDGEYRTMVCVETTNAADDVVTVPPGGTHQLTTLILAEPLPAGES